VADQLALAGESGIGKWHTSTSLMGMRLTTVYLGLLVGSGKWAANRSVALVSTSD
jgi:ABC-type dipeptide/oligopeptide/nickel transport system ATPase component